MADPAKVTVADPSVALLQFLTGLGGTTGSRTTSSTLDPAMLAQMQTLLGTMMGQTTPEGAAAMIQQVFNQGAKGAPVLAQQFASSAGARANNNSPLLLANTRLQTELAGKAMELLSQLQTNAGNLGGKLVDATKTTTETSTSGKTSKSGAAMAALPFILGQAGNIKKLFNGASDLFSGSDPSGFGSVGGGSGVAGFIGNNPSAYIADSGISSVVDTPALSFDGDVGNSFDFGSFDLGSIFDWSPAAADVANTAASSFDVGSIFDWSFEDLGLFLADGGLVPGKRNQKKSLTAKPRGYADGGEVLEDPAAIVERGSLDPAAIAAATAAPVDTGMPDFSGETLPQDVLDWYATVPEYVNYNQYGSGVHMPGVASDGKMYFATGNTEMGGGEDATLNATMRISGIRQREATGSEDTYQETHPVDKVFNRDGSYQDIVVNPVHSSGIKEFGKFLTTAIALASGNPALAFAKSMVLNAGSLALGDALQKDRKKNMFGGVDRSYLGGSTAALSGSGFPARMADGGQVAPAKQASDPRGIKDKVLAHLSPGEFVIPADVVDILGVDALNALITTYHTPAAQQKKQG